MCCENNYLFLWKLKAKGIKKNFKIFIITAAAVTLLLASPFILLQFSGIQNFVADFITSRLSKTLDTRIEIGRVDYRFFNKLDLTDLYIEDQSKDTLFHAGHLTAAFEFKSFFTRKLIFSGIEAKNLYGNIKTDSTGRSNMDFLFELEKKKKDSTFIDLRLDKLTLKNSRLRYRNTSELAEKETFNPYDILLTGLNTEIYIRKLDKDTVNAGINYFFAEEKSGFIISDVQAKMHGSPKGFKFPVLKIKLPDSEINMSQMSLKINSYDDLRSLEKKGIIHFPVKNAKISLYDLKAFFPGLKGIREQVKLDALITGRFSNLRLQNMSVRYGNSFEMDANMDVSGLPNIEEAFFFGQINNIQMNISEIQDFISALDEKPMVFSPQIMRLGTIGYKGNITGFLSDLVAFGNFSTNVGTISSDISLRFQNHLRDVAYSGRLRTNNLMLGRMFNTPELGRLSIDLRTSGTKKAEEDIRGTINARVRQVDFNNYSYNNAIFDGSYNGSGFNGNIVIKDENIEADFTGILDFRNPRIPVFDFELDLQNTNLHALNLIKAYSDSRLSFKGKTNMSGNNLDNLNGFLHFTDIVFSYDNRTLNGNEIHFTSRTEPTNTRFIVRSDYLNGSFAGNFKYSTIGYTFRSVLSQYLPALSDNNGNSRYEPNIINIDFEVQNINEITQVLQLPYEIEGTATIMGDIDERRNKIDFQARVNAFKTNNQIFDNVNIRADNQNRKLQLTGRARMIDKKSELMNVFLAAEAGNNDLSAKLIWQNNREITNAGEVDTRTTFSRTNNQVKAHTRINPTQVIISDSIWDIRSSNIYFESDSLINISNFKFEGRNEFFHIDGIASHNNSDIVTVTMNALNLDYAMQLLRMSGIVFGGTTTGQLKISNFLKEPIFIADLDILDFSINKHRIGDALVVTNWDNEKNEIRINTRVMLNENDTAAIVTGVYVPSTDSLDLNVQSYQTSTAFLNRYFTGVVSNFGGMGRGDVRIFGPTKDITVLADVFVTGGTATVDMLKTTYRFNDRVVLTREQILIDNVTLLDEDGNPAIANGVVTHDGQFNTFLYDVRIRANNILAMNTRSVDDDFFYGRAYMGGTVHIHGNDDEANIVVNGTSRPRTKIYLSLAPSSSSVLESDFIRFVSRNINLYEDYNETETRQFVNERQFNVKVDMQFEVTPDAEIEIIVDPTAGDKLTGRGRGNIRVVFNTFSPAEVYGTVELEQGFYLFTLQTVIRKEFRLNEGSTLTFTGDPFRAKVDIHGYYPLTASLADLIEREELRQLTSRATVPVHCLLHLTEDLMAPNVRLDLDLPASDESLKSRVRSLVNTEEMMNRQILYLLLFHKFFTPEEMRASTATGFNEGWSFAAATLSSQVNNLIQNTLNSDILSLGFDWQKSDVASDEIKAQVLIQPNNRLIINGNIGYRNDNISDNRFIGDFDLEYKLLESGKVRFIAYNHTIDRAQLREAKTTQGVGLLYREEFNNLQEMLNYYWNALRGIFTRSSSKDT